GRLGFDISDSAVKRAGLDYWENLDLVRHETVNGWRGVVQNPARVFYFSKKASRTIFDVNFQKGDWLVFGKETVGLSDDLLREVEPQTVRIPQWGPIRSLNLSNAATVAVYEGLRQIFGLSSSTVNR